MTSAGFDNSKRATAECSVYATRGHGLHANPKVNRRRRIAAPTPKS